jgi:hypothetical protein
MSGNSSASGGYLQSITTAVEDDALVDELTAAVSGIVGIPPSLVRPRWQKVPVQQPPVDVDWVAVGIQTRHPMDYPSIKHDPTLNNGMGGDVLTRNQKVDCICIFYGPNAGANAGACTDGFYIPQNWEALNALGVRMHGAHDTNNTNELINAQWVPRVDAILRMQREIKRVYNIYQVVKAPQQINTDPATTSPIVTQECS